MDYPRWTPNNWKSRLFTIIIVWSQNSVAFNFHEYDRICILYCLCSYQQYKQGATVVLLKGKKKVEHSVDKVNFNYYNHYFLKDALKADYLMDTMYYRQLSSTYLLGLPWIGVKFHKRRVSFYQIVWSRQNV